MGITLFFFDTETTGTHPINDDMWQIAGMVEIDGKVVDAINIKMKPRNINRMTPFLYKMFGTTEQEMMGFMDREEAFDKLVMFFSKYTDTDKYADSLIPVGHNASGFDMGFFKKFFDEEFKHKKIDWRWLLDYHCLDTMVLAHLAALTGNFPESADSLKLSSLCEMAGIPFDEDEAHDALYDVKKTRQLWKVFMEHIDIKPF